MAVLARLIAQEDFGLFATIAVMLGLADFFVEAGLGSAIIHRQNATRQDLATAYTTNILLGWLVFGVVIFSSPLIARFYNDDRLVELLKLSALIFLFQPFGRQYYALLRRDFQFDIIAKLEIVVTFCGFAISLVLSWNEWGVKALIYSQLAATLISTIVLIMIGYKRYGFNIGFSRSRARYFLRFGAFQICENIINYFNTQLDTVLLGKLLGQETLGVFYLAKQLAFRPIDIINPIFNKISLPLFAKVQNDDERLKRGYLQVVHSLAIIHFAMFPIIAGFSYEIIHIFLGSHWAGAEHLLKILAFYTMLRAVGNPIGSLQVAKGRVDLGFYWNFGMLFYTPPIVVFASRWNATGVALGLLAAMLGAMIPGWYFLTRKLCGATFSEYFGNLAKTALLATFCFGLLFTTPYLFTKLLLLAIGTTVYVYAHIDVLKNMLAAAK